MASERSAAPTGFDPEIANDPTKLLYDPSVTSDPHAAFRHLRDECPVAHTKISPSMRTAPGVFITRWDDVYWALRHPDIFSSCLAAIDIGQTYPMIPLQTDPPDHMGYRLPFNNEFSPKRIAELEPATRRVTNELIDAFIERGECEMHREFATPLPSTVFLELMGLPQSDLPMFLKWRDDLIRPAVAMDDIEGARRVRQATVAELDQYFRDAMDERRRRPDDGFLTRLLDFKTKDRPFDEDELLGSCMVLFVGGLDTVTATLDCAFTYLADHDAHREELATAAAGDGIDPVVVEEVMRYLSPVVGVARVATQDVELHGEKIAAGTNVAIVLGAANSDERLWEDPDTMHFERERRQNMAFGMGPHLCLGIHLARMEVRIALEEWHRRIPDYHVKDGFTPLFTGGIRQADAVPLVFDTVVGTNAG